MTQLMRCLRRALPTHFWQWNHLISVDQPGVWIPTLELGLGLWLGEHRGKNRQWLRWYDVAL